MCIGSSSPRQNRGSCLLSQQRVRSQIAWAAQEEAVVAENIAFRTDHRTHGPGKLRVDAERLQGAGRFRESKQNVKLSSGTAAGVIQHSFIVSAGGAIEFNVQWSWVELFSFPLNAKSFG